MLPLLKILDEEYLREHHPGYSWGNGMGNRFANKFYNYTLIYTNGTTHLYSQDGTPVSEIDPVDLKNFIKPIVNRGRSTCGIYLHSIATSKEPTHPIRTDIRKEIKKRACVVCGTHSTIECDHKNDLYNDMRVLNTKTQTLDDFQPLCKHCNALKREAKKKKFSAKELPMYSHYSIDFYWEQNPEESFWYDPIKFRKRVDDEMNKSWLQKIYMYFQVPLTQRKRVEDELKLVRSNKI